MGAPRFSSVASEDCSSSTTQALPSPVLLRRAMACTVNFSLGEVSYSKTFWSTQPSRLGRGVAIRSVRLNSGCASFQAWETASAASVAVAKSTTTMLASPSGAVIRSSGPVAMTAKASGGV